MSDTRSCRTWALRPSLRTRSPPSPKYAPTDSDARFINRHSSHGTESIVLLLTSWALAPRGNSPPSVNGPVRENGSIRSWLEPVSRCLGVRCSSPRRTPPERSFKGADRASRLAAFGKNPILHGIGSRLRVAKSSGATSSRCEVAVYPAMAHGDHPRTDIRGLVAAVRDVDQRKAKRCMQPQDLPAQVQVQLGVQAGQRLVHEHDRRGWRPRRAPARRAAAARRIALQAWPVRDRPVAPSPKLPESGQVCPRACSACRSAAQSRGAGTPSCAATRRGPGRPCRCDAARVQPGCARRSATSVPSMLMAPESGTSRPATRRSTVVLPQPEGPTSATRSPRSTDTENSSTTRATVRRPSTPRAVRWRSSVTCGGSEQRTQDGQRDQGDSHQHDAQGRDEAGGAVGHQGEDAHRAACPARPDRPAWKRRDRGGRR